GRGAGDSPGPLAPGRDPDGADAAGPWLAAFGGAAGTPRPGHAHPDHVPAQPGLSPALLLPGVTARHGFPGGCPGSLPARGGRHIMARPGAVPRAWRQRGGQYAAAPAGVGPGAGPGARDLRDAGPLASGAGDPPLEAAHR